MPSSDTQHWKCVLISRYERCILTTTLCDVIYLYSKYHILASSERTLSFTFHWHLEYWLEKCFLSFPKPQWTFFDLWVKLTFTELWNSWNWTSEQISAKQQTPLCLTSYHSISDFIPFFVGFCLVLVLFVWGAFCHLNTNFKKIFQNHHRILKWFGLKEDTENYQVSTHLPRASKLSIKPGCPEPYPTWPWTLPWMGHPQTLRALHQYLSAPIAKNFFLISNPNIVSFYLNALPPVLSLHPHVNNFAPSFL